MQAKHSRITGSLVIVVLLGAVVFCCSPGFAQNFVSQPASFTPGLADTAASWGDYNNDGYVDLVTNGNLLRNNGGLSFSTTDWSFGWGGSIWGDFNNDGLDDVLLGAPFGSPNTLLLSGESYVVFGRGSTFTQGAGAINEVVDIAPGDRVVYRVSATIAPTATVSTVVT